jgi:hypothetical protein
MKNWKRKDPLIVIHNLKEFERIILVENSKRYFIKFFNISYWIKYWN